MRKNIERILGYEESFLLVSFSESDGTVYVLCVLSPTRMHFGLRLVVRFKNHPPEAVLQPRTTSERLGEAQTLESVRENVA